MEYIAYISGILVVVGLCVYKVRALGHDSRLAAVNKSGNISSADQLTQANQVQQRELLKVPTPWGWPGHPKIGGTHHKHPGPIAATSNQDPAALHRWVDHLVSAKQTTNNGEYLRRRDASMRALLEDRFVSSSHMAKVDYQKTKAPLLRDPSEPHDQMDNFPSGHVSRIESKLKEQTEPSSASSTKVKTLVYEESPLVRTPWGW